jgi:hypothetical protein
MPRMDYPDDPPETDNPVTVIGVTAKCTVCDTAERCDNAGEAKRLAREHQRPREYTEFRRRWAER